MALIPDNVPTQLSDEDIAARFLPWPPSTAAQREYQEDIALAYRALAETINRDVADGRHKSLSLTALEESLYWLEAAILA